MALLPALTEHSTVQRLFERAWRENYSYGHVIWGVYELRIFRVGELFGPKLSPQLSAATECLVLEAAIRHCAIHLICTRDVTRRSTHTF